MVTDMLRRVLKTISGQILEATLQNLQYNDSCKIVTEKHTVNLPLRVNWGWWMERYAANLL